MLYLNLNANAKELSYCTNLTKMLLNIKIYNSAQQHQTQVEEVKCRNPTLAKCGGEAQHLEKSEDLESFGTPECLGFDSKAQNTSH